MPLYEWCPRNTFVQFCPTLLSVAKAKGTLKFGIVK